MCGIVGYIGKRSAAPILIEGLKRLEYRGYDSAGVALLMDHGIEIQKAEGRLQNVEKLIQSQKKLMTDSHCGIGHTRWATHGKPNTINAHPHRADHVVLVHNGIIENYLEIRKKIIEQGHQPISETDSELFGYLVLNAMAAGASLKDAVRESFSWVEGQCSVVVMSDREPGVMIGVRNGSPLVAGIDPQGGAILASDAQPLLSMTKEVFFLEHGDGVVATQKGLEFFDLPTGASVSRSSTLMNWSVEQLDKAGYPHYMLKEIYEQPTALIDTFNEVIDRSTLEVFSFHQHPGLPLLAQAEQLVFVACGTSWHAALAGKYWLEKWARIPVSVEYASEFRYRKPVLKPGTVVIGISQSGETADTLAVLRELRGMRVPTLGITNVRGSSISREADAVFYTSAGPEIGVAATKTFLSQLLMMVLFSGYLALKHSTQDRESISQFFDDLIKLPHLLTLALEEKSKTSLQTVKAAKSIGEVKGFFFIGRGYSYPLALEAALKLKEISYEHAEGYAAGELKHGPIAMIDQGMVVVVLAPRDVWRDKTVFNLEEVKARGAQIIAVGDSGDSDLKQLSDVWIPLPAESRNIHQDLLPFILSVIIQLLSYHRAVFRGTDIDKPRNLAKSVTVE